jgi:hypothetical protein
MISNCKLGRRNVGKVPIISVLYYTYKSSESELVEVEMSSLQYKEMIDSSGQRACH